MPEFLAAIVGRKTTIAEGFERHAAHQSMTTYLLDWEQAHARLGRRIAELRQLRDDRRAASAAGTWPPERATS